MQEDPADKIGNAGWLQKKISSFIMKMKELLKKDVEPGWYSFLFSTLGSAVNL